MRCKGAVWEHVEVHSGAIATSSVDGGNGERVSTERVRRTGIEMGVGRGI